MLISTCMVAVMTLWATSSPFSPLSQQSYVEPDYQPVSMPQKVTNTFALSESVLLTPTLEPPTYPLQDEIRPPMTASITRVVEQTDADGLTHKEKTHAMERDDRNAWQTFRRQESLSMTKPILRATELPLRENVAMEASTLPEVHFTSADPRPFLPKPNQIELETAPKLPTQLSLTTDKSSTEEEQPSSNTAGNPAVRIANLPVPPLPYVSPFGFQSAPRVIQSGPRVIQSAPTLPQQYFSQQRNWETGLY